jgi:curved DNA-binding protein CbpA
VHPDASRGADAEVAALNEAWRVLSDPARRARYDESIRPRTDTSQPAHDQLVASLELAAIAAVVVLVLLAFIALTQSG